MKTLANCTPEEFLIQTNKIRNSVENWLTLTGIMEIRKTLPDMPKDISKEDRDKALNRQVKLNFHKMLDAVLGEHPKETAEVLGLLCFVDPEDLNKHPMTYYLASVTDIIDSPEVIGFFSSLLKTGLIDISGGVNL